MRRRLGRGNGRSLDAAAAGRWSGARPGFALGLAGRIVGAAGELAVAAHPHHLGLAASRARVVFQDAQRRRRRGDGAFSTLDVLAVGISRATDELSVATLAVEQRLAAVGRSEEHTSEL